MSHPGESGQNTSRGRLQGRLAACYVHPNYSRKLSVLLHVGVTNRQRERDPERLALGMQI